ncbi:MAG: adenylate/guanylate cyclase domain-containing protein [Nitrospinae bacterium]|nr:adenylate/guanylate cyclase domain-containing protein [Nitrospinota bacterium]
MSTEWWQKYLQKGHAFEGIARAIFSLLPSDPRCKICYVPFGGVGRLLKFLGWAPSRKNPRLCVRCCERLPIGGMEIDITVLFADVRNYTAFSEQRSPTEVVDLMNRFYRLATQVLVDYDAIIDKMMGDSVMAFFIPSVAGPGYCRKAVLAGAAILRGVGYDTLEASWLQVGIGINSGLAFVGNVGSENITDFTAIGDTVNIASRLQAQAAPGEILMTEPVYACAFDKLGELQKRTLSLKGKEKPIEVRSLHLSSVT